jgi:hypothetical protein
VSSRPTPALAALGMTLLLAGCGVAGDSGSVFKDGDRYFPGPVARAACGPGSIPETGLQGQVPRAERDSGRSREGYQCNMEMVGTTGTSATQGGAKHEDCYYFGRAWGPQVTGTQVVDPNPEIGTRVVDVSDSASPAVVAHLDTAAMLGPWESLRVTAARELLAANAGYGPAGNGPLFFDLYDIKDDCKAPALVTSVPFSVPNGHEGNWSPDGLTYYSSGGFAGTTAIDVANPASPVPFTQMEQGTHGLNLSNDGNRAYMTRPACGNGLQIVDVSGIQARSDRAAAPPVVGEVCWTDGAIGQATIPITIGGHPYVIYFDEGGGGGARIIDIADETAPRVISRLALEVHLPDIGAAAAGEDGVSGPGTGGVNGYNSHYCNVPWRDDPGVVVCSMYNSGLRLIDIRDPYAPRELAYFKPKLPDTVTAPDFVAPHEFRLDRNEIWVTDRASGAFYAVRITNGVWPFRK